MNRKCTSATIGLLLCAGAARAESPAGTAFTYQGRLSDAGSPVDGAVNMEFTLWDDEDGGNQVGPTLTFDGAGGNPPPVDVIDGLFTVWLDFGAEPYVANSGRWLEITVDGQPLNPRRPLTPAPYALSTRGLTVDAAGNVGIGTTTPAERLSVAGIIESTNSGFKFPDGSVQNSAAAEVWELSSSLAGWGSNGDGQTDVPAGTFTAVEAGGSHSLAIRSDGTLAGWGNNDEGQTNVPAGTFTAVAAGDLHSLAIRSDGTLAGCLSGPGGGLMTGSCACSDTEPDGDVDFADFAALEGSFE